jgi:hypothetical protein
LAAWGAPASSCTAVPPVKKRKKGRRSRLSLSLSALHPENLPEKTLLKLREKLQSTKMSAAGDKNLLTKALSERAVKLRSAVSPAG